MNIKLWAMTALTLPLMLTSVTTHAEIYKWKDSEGRVRYSDIPPPSNVKQEAMTGKKIPKVISVQPPLSPVNGNISDAMDQQNATDASNAASKADAEKRAKEAELQKNDDAAKQAAQNLNAENCKASQKNLQAYSDGGRFMRINDAGEREFLSDQDIERKLADARKDVEKYCN